MLPFAADTTLATAATAAATASASPWMATLELVTMSPTVVELLRSIAVEAVALADTLLAIAEKTSAALAPTAATWVTVLWTWTPADKIAAAAWLPPMASATGS